MPDLHELLTDAVPPVDPPFDEADVRARLHRAQRRSLLVVTSVAVLLVAVVGGVVATRGGVEPAQLADDVVPLLEWPASIDFIGVEIVVDILDEPTEPLEYRVRMGDGQAALTTTPSDALEPGNTSWQRVQHRLWFSCGTSHVVRMVARGAADTAPEFTIPGPQGRWLPAGALVEAGRRLAESMRCDAAAPDGAPVSVVDAQPWVGDLAAAMEAAGLATCCANPTSSGQNDWYLNDWGVLLEGDDRLSLSVARSGTGDFLAASSVRVVDMAGGQALVRSAPDTPGESVELVCGDAHVLAYPTSGDASSVERFATRIGCTPELPAGFPRASASAEPQPTEAQTSTGPVTAIDQLLDALGDVQGASVADVEDDGATGTFTVALPGATTPISVRVAVAPQWDVDGDTRLVPLGHGEAAVLDDGSLAFACPIGASMAITAPGAADLPANDPFVEAIGCTPVPPPTDVLFTEPGGTTLPVSTTVRELRLFEAFEALGLQRCCGWAPADMGATARTGVMWNGLEVHIDANPPAMAEGWVAARVVALAGGQADLGDGDGLPTVTFVCDDTLYSIRMDAAGQPHIEVAEALASHFGCTPEVTW